jgi:hypothetical protein
MKGAREGADMVLDGFEGFPRGVQQALAYQLADSRWGQLMMRSRKALDLKRKSPSVFLA